MRRLLKREIELLSSYDWSGLELFLSSLSFFWGLVILINADALSGSPSLSKLSFWFNDYLFGSATLILGAFGIYAVRQYLKMIRGEMYAKAIDYILMRQRVLLAAIGYWLFSWGALAFAGKTLSLGGVFLGLSVLFLFINVKKITKQEAALKDLATKRYLDGLAL